MEYYAPAQGAPSSFPGLETSVTDPIGGADLSSLARREQWHRQHGALSGPSGTTQSGFEEAMWRMTLQSQEGMEALSGPFPERPGEPDCAHYMRTGHCGYGMSCRFNHPLNRRLVSAAPQSRGEYPERIGQPECQYYLKTGTCKFGATCKYHHPREKGGMPQLNSLNLPLRPGEKDCQYYMRTVTCKYGRTCKFNHPEPAVGTLVSMPGSQFYPGAGPGSAPVPQPYVAGLPTWPVARAPYLPSPRLPGPPSFTPVLLPPHQRVMPMAGWNTYQGHLVPLVSPEGQQQPMQASYAYGSAPQQDPVALGLQTAFSPYMPSSAAMGLPMPPSPSTSGLRETFFPERPGQPECQYYMKTGDCKFGMTCRFHHPREKSVPSATYALSPMGLPLRPGAPQCTFYSRNGFCKFGPTCKFDHPVVGLGYSQSGSFTDIPGTSYSIGSSSTILAPSTSETRLVKPTSTAGPSNDPTSSL